jgi:vacuolar-type H+-ATPase subunit H
MNQDILKDIRDAEDRIQQQKAETQAAAKNMIAEAERKGLTTVSDAVARAEEEAARLLEETQRQADRTDAEVREAAAKKQDALRREALSRLDEAAGIIVERIVNG